MNEEDIFCKNVFNNFIKKVNITDELKKSIQIFMENKDINDFFDESTQKELKDIIKKNVNDDFLKHYINVIFYECIADYLMIDKNLESINNLKNIFLIIIYMPYQKQYEFMVFVYNYIEDSEPTKVDSVNNNNLIKKHEDIIKFFNYELLSYFYTIMENYESRYIDDYYDYNLKEFTKLEYYEMINKYYELIIKLYNDGIIKNKLYYSEEDLDKELTIIDIFIHSSYILELRGPTLIFLKIIIEKIKKLKDEEYIEFLNYKVNTDILGDLSDAISNVNREYIYIINKKLEEYNIYTNKFMYFLNKSYIYLYLKKKSLEDFNLNYKNLKDYLDEYYNDIYRKKNLNIFDFDNKKFDPMEFIEIIRDIIYLDNIYLLENVVDSIEKSKELNMIPKLFMIIIWFRYIYVGPRYINKYNKKPVKHFIEEGIYYVDYGRKEKIIIDKDEYINDIIIYLDKIEKDSKKIFEFFIKSMDNFVNDFIPNYNEQLNKKKECNNCPICFEDINIENKIICTYCKNIFHETCINSAWKKNIDNCPMCRELIVKYFFYYSKMRSDLIYDIYNLVNKK
jgi:hypothetical protein